MLKAKEEVRIQVIRDGKVIYDVKEKGNTLTSDFLLLFKQEVTANSDVLKIPPLYQIEASDQTVTLGTATLSSSDISIDTANLKLTVNKSINITTAGVLRYIYLWLGSGSPLVVMTSMAVTTYITVNVGDVVIVTYTGTFSIVASNLAGLLSDASLTYNNMIVRLLYRLANQSTASLRVANVSYCDEQGNGILLVSTQNDNSNYVIIAPQTAMPQTANIKIIKFMDSLATDLLVWTKASAVSIPQGSNVSISVNVS
jgi:hypothetical protein